MFAFFCSLPFKAREAPINLSWPEMKKDFFYTILMVDVDAPSRFKPDR